MVKNSGPTYGGNNGDLVPPTDLPQSAAAQNTPDQLFANAQWVGDYLRLNDQWRTTANVGFYDATAAHLLQKRPPKSGEVILDIACGTGISTAAILAAASQNKETPTISIRGIDRSLPSLAVAKLCFGSDDIQAETVAEKIFNPAFPIVDLARWSGKVPFDCKQYLEAQRVKWAAFSRAVKFQPGDFLAIQELATASIDLAIGSHALHWVPQGDGGSTTTPNRDYENRFFAALARVLKPGGHALLNTNADWCSIYDPTIAGKHALNHPFVRRVIDLVFEQVDSKRPAVEVPKLYSREHLDELLQQHNLELEMYQEWTCSMDPAGMYAYLLTALKMVTFSVMPAEIAPVKPEEQSTILRTAIETALSEGLSPQQAPFTYAMVDMKIRRR